MQLLFRKRLGMLLVACILWSMSSVHASYIPTLRDDDVLDKVERRVAVHVELDQKLELVNISKWLVERLDDLKDDPQAQYLMYEILQVVQGWFEKVIRERWAWTDDTTWDSSSWAQGRVSSISDRDIRVFMSDKEKEDFVDAYVIREYSDEQQSALLQEESQTASGTGEELVDDVPVIEVPTPDTLFSRKEFHATYIPYVQTIGVPIDEACIAYYDEIDFVAKEHDFPTSLIIAMWWREHSCTLSNPSNGRGNFQITSHYYEPWEITIDELIQQVKNFIDFSKAKREWYDVIQVFDERPVQISYDRFDLTSIRKHSVLYNGLYADVTPENSWYSNDNFTTNWRERDGIVATMLKVLAWEKDQNTWE